MSLDRADGDVPRIISDMLYDYKRGESQQAATALARGLSEGLDSRSRGAKEAGYFVLRNTLIPAVLVEVGFLSNSREEKQLATASFREQIAESLAENIANYARKRWD
jgi:N-acetylmuramoyl-L-alanine amidase